MKVNVLRCVIGLSFLYSLPGYGSDEKTIEFDVPYGHYTTYLKQDVGAQGELTCKVSTSAEKRSVKWVPSLILAAAEDKAEDDTLFLSSFAQPDSRERVFKLRTFNKAQPVIASEFITTTDEGGIYSLRLTWQADGSIGYQVANGDKGDWSELQMVQKPGFSVRHVSVHVSGMSGRAICQVR